VLVSVNIMEQEHVLISMRQLLQSGVKVDTVEKTGEAQVWTAEFQSGPFFFIIGPSQFIKRDSDRPLLAETHQHDISGEAMQPRRKGGFTAEGVDLAKELQEGLLRQVLRFDRIRHHTKAERIDAAAVHLVDSFESGSIALLSQANGFFEIGSVRLERPSTLRCA